MSPFRDIVGCEYDERFYYSANCDHKLVNMYIIKWVAVSEIKASALVPSKNNLFRLNFAATSIKVGILGFHNLLLQAND